MTQTRYWERLISRGEHGVRRQSQWTQRKGGGCHSLLFHEKGFSVFRLPIAVCWKIAQTHKHTHTQNSWEWVQCRGWPAGGSPQRKENGDESLPRGRRRGWVFQLLSSSSWDLQYISYILLLPSAVHKSQVCDCEFSTKLVCCSQGEKQQQQEQTEKLKIRWKYFREVF